MNINKCEGQFHISIKMKLRTSPASWRPFRLSLNMLMSWTASHLALSWIIWTRYPEYQMSEAFKLQYLFKAGTSLWFPSMFMRNTSSFMGLLIYGSLWWWSAVMEDRSGQWQIHSKYSARKRCELNHVDISVWCFHIWWVVYNRAQSVHVYSRISNYIFVCIFIAINLCSPYTRLM